jgi:hypothetical protein
LTNGCYARQPLEKSQPPTPIRGTISADGCSADARSACQGGLMLATKHRLTRNPFFHFHPLHNLFSLVAALILFGLMVWLLAVPAR